MDDFLAATTLALAAFALWLDSVTPIPWPLVLALVFPPLVVAFRVWIWLMRGMVWPTSCAYTTTRRGFCKRAVPGEWYRCWQHGRRWVRRTDGHVVNPGLNRWEVRDKYGRPLQGVGFLRSRHGTDTLLFHKLGFTRRPAAAARYLVGEWRSVWVARARSFTQSVRTLSLRAVVSEHDFEHGGVSSQAYRAADVMRTILPTIVAGLCFTGLSVAFDDDGRQLAQYMATACFVAAWGFARYGLWRDDVTSWRASAHRQTVLWFGGFMIAALIVGIVTGVKETAALSQ